MSRKRTCAISSSISFCNFGGHVVKLSENKANQQLWFCLTVQLKTHACQVCAHPRSQFAHSYAIVVFFFDFSVPVVQRTEQGFPNPNGSRVHGRDPVS